MTLKQGCELWATFDSEDVDPSRGIVRDRSGKGRTLEASGGPTFGQASPVGEAVGTDGTDDGFVVPPLFDMTTGPYTFASIFKTSETGSVLFHPRGEADLDFAVSGGGEPSFKWFNGSSVDIVSASDIVSDGEYHTVIWEQGSGQRIFVDGSLSVKDDAIFDPLPRSIRNTLFKKTTNNHQFECAFVSLWSRVLSDAEIEELNRMTDRMVSKL